MCCLGVIFLHCPILRHFLKRIGNFNKKMVNPNQKGILETSDYGLHFLKEGLFTAYF